jgi:hypothetical protein
MILERFPPPRSLCFHVHAVELLKRRMVTFTRLAIGSIREWGLTIIFIMVSPAKWRASAIWSLLGGFGVYRVRRVAIPGWYVPAEVKLADHAPALFAQERAVLRVAPFIGRDLDRTSTRRSATPPFRPASLESEYPH